MSQNNSTKPKKTLIWGLTAGAVVMCCGVVVCALGIFLLSRFRNSADLPPEQPQESPPAVIPEETETIQTTFPETSSSFEPEITDDQGVSMVLVSEGEFLMGSETADFPEEAPIHTVRLDAFYMDKYEVTNALYQACEQAGACLPPRSTVDGLKKEYYTDPSLSNYPVFNVDWYQAGEFCAWREARLPTEAEWEKAARGTDGRTYPWGEGAGCNRVNFYDGSQNCIGATTSVGNYASGVSPYGIFDMAGNVWEWVADGYSKDYYANSPYENPLGSDTSQLRAMRGGGWNFDAMHVRTSYRAGIKPDEFYFYLGFRCARDTNP